jgi:hypothetical protein
MFKIKKGECQFQIEILILSMRVYQIIVIPDVFSIYAGICVLVNTYFSNVICGNEICGWYAETLNLRCDETEMAISACVCVGNRICAYITAQPNNTVIKSRVNKKYISAARP